MALTAEEVRKGALEGAHTIATPAMAWKVPTRLDAAWHRLRVWGHVLLRAVQDMTVVGVQRHRPTEHLKQAPAVAESRTPLWRDGREDEFPLVAGKVHNLRIARSAFDGVVVPAGSVFSFWRQLGRPSRWRGFVEGREVRAGCVVPTIAGGLCQLSNALATCAVACGMTLLERHGHTARIENESAAEGEVSVDATVFWNYVDLRFAADFDFRVEVELTTDELVVRMRAAEAPSRPMRKLPGPIPIAADRPTPIARGCLTCDEIDCFRHRGHATTMTRGGKAAVLVNAWTPEFARYLGEHAGQVEWFTPWVRPSRRVAGWWAPSDSSEHRVAVAPSLRRTLLLRRHAGEGGRRQAAILQGNAWLVNWYASRLQAHHTHLVVDQSLLVPLAHSGALGGRTYEVLMQSLPAEELQRRLDVAAQRWPDADSLRDFRVGEAHCKAEIHALRRAQRLVTPHAELARHLKATIGGIPIEAIAWQLPPPQERQARGRRTTPVVAFPASALARKGALEMAQALRHLGWRLLVLGTPSRDPRLWEGVDVTHVSYRDPTWLTQADVAALPAYVEHSPRGLLTAIAHGLPVVATPECGLPPRLGSIEVPAGDTASLIAALERALSPGA